MKVAEGIVRIIMENLLEPLEGGEVEYIEDDEVKLSVKNWLSDSSTLISQFHDITGKKDTMI